MKILIGLLFLIFFFFTAAKAQQVLLPGNTTFDIASIILGNGTIFFVGDKSYLNVYWGASYLGNDSFLNTIGAYCYLNCDLNYFFCNSTVGVQNCSYIGPTGIGVCTIINPLYRSPLSLYNNVSCKFFNPDFPDIEYKTSDGRHILANFTPVYFNFFTDPISGTVGQQFSYQVNVINLGLFTDNYTVSVNSTSPSIAIDPLTATNKIGPLKGQSFISTPETGLSVTRITITSVPSGGSPQICVTVTSEVSGISQGPICQEIKAGLSSLPDLDIFSIFQVLIISTIILLISRKKQILKYKK